MMARIHKFSGIVRFAEDMDGPFTLFIGPKNTPIAKRLKFMSGKIVTVRYWISDKEKPDAEIKKGAIESLIGSLEAEYESRYNEITGWLWTDEELNVGSHDLLTIIKSHEGKYMLLEIQEDTP